MKEIKIQSDSELQMYGPFDCLSGICGFFGSKPVQTPPSPFPENGNVLDGFGDAP